MKPETRKRLVRAWMAFVKSHAEEFNFDDDAPDWTTRFTQANHRVRTTRLALLYCQQLYIHLGIDALDADRDLMWELHPINIASFTREELEEDGFFIDETRQAKLKAGGYL